MASSSTYWNIDVILLLFLLGNAFFVSSACAGSSNSPKKKDNESHQGKLSPNNPFLQNHETAPDYRANPFLTVSILIANNSGSNSPFMEKDNPRVENRDIPDYVHNPFLGSTTSAFAQPTNKSESSFSSNTNEERPNVTDVPKEKLEPYVMPAQSLSSQQRTKSDLKCEEYGKQFLGTADVQSLVGTNTQVIKVENERCTTPDRLVTGGMAATPGEFPHMVALGKLLGDGTFLFSCGGSLISPSWVLTAAHCTHGQNGSPTAAKIGFHNLKDKTGGIVIGIEKMLRHPTYKPPAMYADIALIQLRRDVTFSTLIKPACLYQLYDTVPMRAWVSGWGVTEFGGEGIDKLQKAKLDIIDNIACSIQHNRSIAVPHGVTPSMICAGDPFGGWVRDTCQGDSGGPLQIPHPKYLCFFQVIGITSFGQGCALENSPGVYTRVSHYLNWIEQNVWPDDY